MKMSNVTRRDFSTFALAAPLVAGIAATKITPVRAEPVLADNGLHTQPFFVDSFLELADDRRTAIDAGKHFAVIFEQRACPYCREMHTVNFEVPEIRDYISQNFALLQLDMWGSREVTDFDGTAMEERQLARRWGVNFTPTIVFFGNEGEISGKGSEAEVMRMPGYFKPFHFISMFEFVRHGHYAQDSFQRFLQDKFERLEKEGKKPDVW